MKAKISISIEQEIVDKLDQLVLTPEFRNKSHVVEFALNKLIQERQ